VLGQPWRRHRWLIIGTLWIAAFLLGAYGFAGHLADRPELSWTDFVYRSLQLFILESGSLDRTPGVELQIARYLAPLVAAVTTLQALALLFYQQLQQLRAGRMRNLVVLCGLGTRGMLLARAFRAWGLPVVAIDRSPSRDRLEECRALGIPVLAGDAARADQLERAGCGRACALVCVSSDDATNAEIAARAFPGTGALPSGRIPPGTSGREGRGRGPLCAIHIGDPELCRILRRVPASERGVHVFNLFETGVRFLLLEHRAWPEKEREPRVLIAGDGAAARCLAAAVQHRWTVDRPDDSGVLRLTALGTGTAPREEEGCLVTALAVDASEWRPAVDEPAPQTAYVCYGSDARSLASAIALARQLPGTRVVLCTALETGLPALLRAGGPDAPENLSCFGLLNVACQPALLLEPALDDLARALHEDHRRRRPADPANRALRPWEELPTEFRESSRRQAEAVLACLHAGGWGVAPGVAAGCFAFREDEANELARVEHERWRRERERAGWSYGAERDDEKKLNPYLVPWEKLGPEQREQNLAAMRHLPELLAGIGYQLYRAKGGGAGRPPARA
jgi:hypothetical protein